MPIANPFVPGRAVDLSSQINLVPNQWGLIQRLGLFTNEYKTQKMVMIPRWTEGEHVLVDRNWDERNSNIVGGKRDYLTLAIPHFPVDDAMTPNDIDGVIDFSQLVAGSDNILSLATVRAEKMARLRKAHSLTLEVARAQVLRDGTVYAPNGTVVTNYYTEFGITRQVVPVDFASTTVNPLGQMNDIIAQLQDAVRTGDVVDRFVALCSPEFFNALITNPFITESYQYFLQAQGPAILNQRLGTGNTGLDARYRVFDYGGIVFVEVRGGAAGQAYVEPGDAYVFPQGELDAFRTFFAPANRFASINKTAQESYFFEYLNERDDIIEVMTETNFLNVLARPELVVTLRLDT